MRAAGGSSCWLGEHAGAQVVGITLSQRQVQRAKRVAAARSLTDCVSFLQADYTCTQFSTGGFDVVWALESHCHTPHKAAFYREAARLLRPSGRLVLADFIRVARPLSPHDERRLHGWLDGWAMPDLATPEEHRHHATAGFGNVRCDDITAHTLPSHARLYRLARWTYPVAVGLRALGLRSAVQHGNVLAALRQYETLIRGLWHYGILTASKA